MKRITKGLLIGLLFALLIGWNVYLNVQVNDLKNSGTKITHNENQGNSQQVSTSITNEVTAIVDKVQSQVVSVLAQNNAGETLGSGSGVIYKNQNGVISVITNHHVVDGGQKIVVRFAAGQEADASVVGSDQLSDLALLNVKIDMDVQPFVLGDSDKTKVGEYVIAIGSPIGVQFENSVTFGIISGKNRVVDVDLNGDGVPDWDMTVLQTDAAINPGNSGGALVNMNGELIGINSLKIASSNVEGIGFSIPINEVLPIIEQIESKGQVDYPIIGIRALSLGDMNPYQRAYYNLNTNQEKGVFIDGVENNSPAAKAGIEKGDVIIGFDDEAVNTFKDFRTRLYKHKVGDVVRLKVIHDQKEQVIEVTLE